VPSFENPMHDGAVIIRDGRVNQAGAFLPLTASTKLDKSLGTRHRAAIGLSEDTDAAVIVVSEERGAVSLCFNGNIVHNLDAASLRTALLGLLTKQPRKRRSRRDADSEAPGGSIRPSQPPRASQAPSATTTGESAKTEAKPDVPKPKNEEVS
jgi:hypothetical protein